jgi:ornithine cyclodeaminase/alanine dehydrogenase-like protein (mu-crystallin family)
MPTVQGVLVLNDARNGAVLAVLDSIELTLLRTAATSALAARHLAREDASVLAIVGCGAQAAAHVAAMVMTRPVLRGFAADIDKDRARQFALDMTAVHGVPFEASASPAEAAHRSDIIVTATTATAPILDANDVRRGTFIAAVGADNPQKCEIAPALMARARVVVDCLSQCTMMGDLHHAIAAGAMIETDIHAEIADIITGAKPGRARDDDVFIFDSTGMALQDVAAACVVYERAIVSGKARFRFA